MYFSISLSSTDPRLDFSSPIHTSPEDQCLSMTHFLTHLTYNGVSTSHEGAVPHTRVSILHGRDVPTLYSRCLDLSRGRHLHILLFSCFHLHALFFPPFSSNSLQYASLSRRSGALSNPSSETWCYPLPFSRKKQCCIIHSRHTMSS